MRFHLVDRVLELEPGKKIRMVKNLTLAEEYLADHFPGFPVMPGVLMLQTLVESAAWLLRISEDYKHSIIALRGVRNVKYGSFMEPGKSLITTVELAEALGDQAGPTFKGKGETFKGKNELETAVSARFTVIRYNLADRDPALKDADDRIVQDLRRQWIVLSGRLG